MERRLESVKHQLWHGNTRSVLEELRVVDEILERWGYDEDGNIVFAGLLVGIQQ